MFKRSHHQQIAFILERLRLENLVTCGCLFGGGTALALQLKEYRESVDIDFLCGSIEEYAKLRKGIAVEGKNFLFDSSLTLSRDLMADRYAIRCSIFPQEGKRPIKFEIILEGYLKGLLPSVAKIHNVPYLHPQDSMATKLMANADRGRDEAFSFRDLIDFIVATDHFGPISQETLKKIELAYQDTAEKAAIKIAQLLVEYPEKLDRAFIELSLSPSVQPLIKRTVKKIAVSASIF